MTIYLKTRGDLACFTRPEKKVERVSCAVITPAPRVAGLASPRRTGATSLSTATMKPYPIQLEISGPTAMRTSPDTGSSPIWYVPPTISAVKGIFESVLRWKSVNIRPTKRNPLRLERGEGRGDVSNVGLGNVGPPAPPKPLLSGEGAFRPEARICEIENHEVPTMLRMVFDQPASFSKN
jgi:CRISPR-associated Cas5-like protein